MAKQKPSDMQVWAQLGVRARLAEIDSERATILKAFPGLKSVVSAGRTGRAATAAADGAVGPKRRKLSAAARKRISDAQKKRWAAQRATKR